MIRLLNNMSQIRTYFLFFPLVDPIISYPVYEELSQNKRPELFPRAAGYPGWTDHL